VRSFLTARFELTFSLPASRVNFLLLGIVTRLGVFLRYGLALPVARLAVIALVADEHFRLALESNNNFFIFF
jgi:hypothetical protein